MTAHTHRTAAHTGGSCRKQAATSLLVHVLVSARANQQRTRRNMGPCEIVSPAGPARISLSMHCWFRSCQSHHDAGWKTSSWTSAWLTGGTRLLVRRNYAGARIGAKARPCIAACDTSSVDEAKRREWRGVGSGPEEPDQVAVRITPKRDIAAVHR